MGTWITMIIEFFKTGLFAVGGGLATLPFLYEIGKKTGWFTQTDILNMLAVSESTPGPMGVNMSTYVGNVIHGPIGGIVATLSLAAPSIIVIILVSKILTKFKESTLVKGIFEGLRPASIGMITAAGLSVAQNSLLHPENLSAIQLTDFASVLSGIVALIHWKGIVLAIVIALGMWKFKKHPIVYIGFAALAGILFSF